MDGITQRFSFDDLIAYRSSSGMKFRTRPPGTVVGPIGHGSLDLPLACARAKALATRTFKFTVTGPHMLAKTLINKHYADTAAVAHALADALAQQVKHLDADIVQIDEANLPGHPEEWEWAATAINRMLDAVQGHAGGAPVLRQLRRPDGAEGHLGQADELPERAARRPCGAGMRAPPARGDCSPSRT